MDKKRNILYIKNLSVVPCIASLILLLIATISILYSIFSGQFSNDFFSLILFSIIAVFFVVGDLWFIYNLINIIKIKIKTKRTEKKSFLSYLFSFLLTTFIILLLGTMGYMTYVRINYSEMNNFTFESFENNLIILFKALMGVGITAYTVQLIMMVQRIKMHMENEKDNNDG